MLYPSKIDERAARLRSGVKALHKPPAQDYANLIEHRRRSRVAENRQMEEGVTQYNNIQKRIQLMNAATEKHRLEGYFRLGQVPAHISHPLARSILKLQPKEPAKESDSDTESDMEVDEQEMADVADVPSSSDGLIPEMGKRGNVPKATQSSTIASARAKQVPNMEDFTKDEVAVAVKGPKGEASRLLYPEAVVSRNIKVLARNAESHNHSPIPTLSG